MPQVRHPARNGYYTDVANRLETLVLDSPNSLLRIDITGLTTQRIKIIKQGISKEKWLRSAISASYMSYTKIIEDDKLLLEIRLHTKLYVKPYESRQL